MCAPVGASTLHKSMQREQASKQDSRVLGWRGRASSLSFRCQALGGGHGPANKQELVATRQLSVVNTIYKFTTAQAFVDVAANQSHLRRNLMGPGLRAQRSRCPPPAMMTCVNQGIVVSLPLQDIEKVKKEFGMLFPECLEKGLGRCQQRMWTSCQARTCWRRTLLIRSWEDSAMRSCARWRWRRWHPHAAHVDLSGPGQRAGWPKGVGLRIVRATARR